MTPFPPPAHSRRDGGALRHDAELTQVLDRLAITGPQDVHVVVGDLPARRGNAHQVARVSRVVLRVDGHDVALTDDMLDLPALVGEDLAEPQHRSLDALETGRLVRPTPVRNDVWISHLGECLEQLGTISSQVRRAMALLCADIDRSSCPLRSPDGPGPVHRDAG